MCFSGVRTYAGPWSPLAQVGRCTLLLGWSSASDAPEAPEFEPIAAARYRLPLGSVFVQ